MKKLVIVESPGKIKKIKSFLPKDFDVIASFGHIADLPKKKLGVDIKKNFSASYCVNEDKKDVVKNILSKAKSSDTIYLMSDPDREGEAIAWHIQNELPAGSNIKRATTNSITKQAILDAIKNAGSIDMDMVASYETRRILDRLVGYKCSYITRSATGGASAGRVQSAALRILAEREKEIKSFIPQEYWDISAELLTENKDKIDAKLTKPDKMEINNQEKAEKIQKELEKQKVKVIHSEKKNVFNSAYAPFTTSTLQQAASTILGWNQSKTMSVAQKLYELGHSTYMRTDSTNIVQECIDEMRKHIESNYGKKYLPSSKNVFSSKSLSQGAHEAIRPTDIKVEKISGTTDEKKLYDLIWRRTIASQMEKSESLQISLKFSYKDYELSANGKKLLFDGWKKIWKYSLSQDVDLPDLKVGDICDIIQVDIEQKFTQPPQRYTEASFVKQLEKSGIGRPSTYASIRDTLVKREYVDVIKKAYHVTDLGIKVSDFLINSNFCFIDISFTKDMEEKLDKISDKSLENNKEETLKEFWERLKKDLETAKEQKYKSSFSDKDCPDCKNKLLIKYSKYGQFFACSNKECDFKANSDGNGNIVVKEKPKKSDYKCHLCKSDMYIRKSQYGEFLGCSSYPKCKGMRSIDGEEIKPKAKSNKKYKYKKKYK